MLVYNQTYNRFDGPAGTFAVHMHEIEPSMMHQWIVTGQIDVAGLTAWVNYCEDKHAEYMLERNS